MSTPTPSPLRERLHLLGHLRDVHRAAGDDRSFARAGLPPRDHRFVRLTLQYLRGQILVARRRTEDVAALLWASVGEVGLNIFHGRVDGDTEGASDLLHRQMFARAIGRGTRVFHAGDMALPGAADPHVLGITHFKTRMGFEVRPTFEGRKVLRPVAAGVREASIGIWSWLRGTTG